ncbi:MAG TPA: PAS domain-containing protein [Methanoregula sp.]|nr:PAS domain-containing protein [Methanoregula sp.]
MVNMSRLTWPVERRKDFVRIVTYVAITTALIFVVDIITPLGIVVWILYLIPLFLTVYLSWKYAPLVMTGIFILLMVASLFLSPRDIPLEYALLNRTFFAFILVVSSIFIEEYVSNVEGLTLSEERYRYLTECSPDGIIVYQQGGIEYVNPAGMRLLGADRKEDLAGLDFTDMIDPEQKALVRERVAQAALGARMVIDKVRLIGQDRNQKTIGISLASVFWNKGKAVQIVMRNGQIDT